MPGVGESNGATLRMRAISPIVAVRDLKASLDFYVDVLGFVVRIQEGHGFACVAREGISINLLDGADEEAAHATANHVAAYVWVNDLDGLWKSLEKQLSTLPEGRVRAPFLQDYGMREFHVKDPDGFLMFFGEDAEET